MTKIIAVVFALLLSLTACGTSEVPTAAPAPTVTVTAEADPVAPVVPEPKAQVTDQQFLAVVRDELPELYADSDASILALADSVCEAFDSGVTFEQVVQLILDGGGSFEYQKDLAALTGMSVAAYCPEHKAKLSR